MLSRDWKLVMDTVKNNLVKLLRNCHKRTTKSLRHGQKISKKYMCYGRNLTENRKGYRIQNVGQYQKRKSQKHFYIIPKFIRTVLNIRLLLVWNCLWSEKGFLHLALHNDFFWTNNIDKLSEQQNVNTIQILIIRYYWLI